jgi:hypothetical protein
MTTRPDASFTSVETVAVTSSPTLFLFERISASVAAAKVAPAGSRLGAADGAAAGVAGAGAAGAAPAGVGFGFGFGAGAGAAAVGCGAGAAAGAREAEAVSLSGAVVSTGASCRSRLRLSAEATSRLSPRPHPTRVSAVKTASMVFDIRSSSRIDLPESRYSETFQPDL